MKVTQGGSIMSFKDNVYDKDEKEGFSLRIYGTEGIVIFDKGKVVWSYPAVHLSVWHHIGIAVNLEVSSLT